MVTAPTRTKEDKSGKEADRDAPTMRPKVSPPLRLGDEPLPPKPDHDADEQGGDEPEFRDKDEEGRDEPDFREPEEEEEEEEVAAAVSLLDSMSGSLCQK